jgi:putative redox protein
MNCYAKITRQQEKEVTFCLTVINSRAKLIEEFRIAVDNGRAHSVVLDLPPEMGTDRGPTALELGVMSFAGCIATIFALMTKKMRVQISDLKIEMKAEKPEGARTVTKAGYVITVTSSESENKIKRAFELTKENCPVGLIFEKAGVQVNYKLKIAKE